MNKKILFVLVIGMLFWQKSSAQEEQRCSSYEYRQFLIATVPGYAEQVEHGEKYFQNYLKTHKASLQSRTIITIPVVVHLLYNPDSINQQLSDWQITSQIDALNEDYRRFNADKFKTPSLFDSIGADMELEFCLAKRDPDGNPTNGIRRVATNVSVFDIGPAMKHSASGGDDAWPYNEYLNIWVCGITYPDLGFTTFPTSIDSVNDGVVIHSKAFGRINCFSKKYYEGRTATHEVGHWFNLFHIDGDEAGCDTDDGVNDTPLEDIHHFGCPEFPSPSCNNTSDIFMNYMDYTNDSCMNIFTFGQRERMLGALNAFRSGLLTSNGCNPVSAYAWDMGVTKILNPDEFIYGDSVKPVVTIHNFGTQTITSADIFYEKNWKSHLNSFQWTGSIAPNESVDVTLPIIADSSWYNLFCAWTKNPNGNQDADTTNDFKTRSYIVSFQYPPITDVVKIYPNPTGGLVTIDFGEIIDLKGKVSIYNVLGQMEQVKMEQLSLSKFQIDLSNFPSELYFIELNVNGEKVVEKVVVQHEL